VPQHRGKVKADIEQTHEERNAPHRYTATGSGTMRLICIHASPVMIQTDLD
jgi:quercetin dioxygenase-like cupin family protein